MKTKTAISKLTLWLLSLLLILSPLSMTACDAEESIELIGEVIDILAETDAETEAPLTDPVFEAVGETAALPPAETIPKTETEAETEAGVVYGNSYYVTEDVALYLYTYHELPENYITKSKAMDLGWDSSKGNLWDVADGCCIGGDRFGNYEGLLPKSGKYHEADVNYEGGYRGADRLIYDENYSVWYTGDHYQTFEKLY